jgi:glycerate dehydrogenase
MKIVVLDGYAANPGDISWAPMEALGVLTVYDRTAPEEVIQRIGDAEMVLTNKVIIDRKVMDACPKLKYIGVLATGYNVVDLAAATEKKIVVTNIPAYSTPSVVQMTFALLLEMCHHVGEHSRAVHQGDWIQSKDFCFWNYPLTELQGKTMCVYGFGRIGRAVAKIALAFGLRVVAVAHHPETAEPMTGVEIMPAEDAFAVADIISLNCPLNAETKDLICSKNIARMKQGVWILNTARGPVVNENELRQALESGRVGAYGADVICVEPMQADCPLLGAPNCILTPHIAWAPKESRQRLMDIAVANVAGFISGRIENQVN